MAVLFEWMENYLKGNRNDLEVEIRPINVLFAARDLQQKAIIQKRVLDNPGCSSFLKPRLSGQKPESVIKLHDDNIEACEVMFQAIADCLVVK
ncbi:hypothetical protein A2160_04045 [Candidatus Beckwithbacteria bacterium RBG_13_42_9]|uniref:Uncharacterized protein n=1 Tax=Candidatus Beckwithbacteria bacterium RBG_13_42_9 TaxID=1797457 RepID=A0A1F5E3C8_9BACT|nr:MAG: hypothetical protein A2160_04045 [Candidatus Beckwithbacteria bacterium RBG_13_42_9]